MGSLSPNPPLQMPGMMEKPRMQPEQHIRKEQAPDIFQAPQAQQAQQAQQESSVKVPESRVKPSGWADISEYDDVYDLLYIFVASIVGVVVLLIFVRGFPELFGKNLNLLFNRFKLLAVGGYVLMLCIILGITRYLYSEFVFLTYDWNPVYFTGLASVVQGIHDVIMYFGVITQVQRGNNAVIDLLKDYVESGGSRIVFGNVLLTSLVSMGSMILKGTPGHVVASIGGVLAYLVPYVLEARNEFSTIS
jgi:hypothetical protein